MKMYAANKEGKRKGGKKERREKEEDDDDRAPSSCLIKLETVGQL